jgi:hypothetical protein
MSAMAAGAVIVHRIPGRARLMVQGMRGTPDRIFELAEAFNRMAKVQRARANPATGSLTLEFIGDLEQVLDEAADADLLTVTEEVRSAARPLSAAEANPMFVIGSVLTMVGVFQTIRGEWFPPAIAVFWYAAEAFRMAAKSR